MSLLDMLKHHAARWFRLAQLMRMLRDRNVEDTEDSRDDDKTLLDLLGGECEPLGLHMARKSIARLQDTLQRSIPLSDAERLSFIKEIEFRITDEMESALFLYITTDMALFYEKTDLFGPNVRELFPETSYDIEEAGKCLATSRGTACVFHLMRVMEILLRRISKLLGIPYAPSWEAYIKQIADRIKAKHRTKGVQWKRDEPFFTDVLGGLEAIKIAWRNPTMHVRGEYTLEEAEDVFRAVRRLAQHLADRESARS
jgi:hypothetical protein